jgi:hypothetical protein
MVATVEAVVAVAVNMLSSSLIVRLRRTPTQSVLEDLLAQVV